VTFRSQIVFILIRLIDATLLIRNSRTVQKKRVLLVNCSDIVLTVFTVNLPRQYQLAMFSFLSGTVSALKKKGYRFVVEMSIAKMSRVPLFLVFSLPSF